MFRQRRQPPIQPRHSFDRSPRRALRGYTVIELSIVILIISIFAAVTTPTFLDSLLFHRVESAARRIKADIDYARQRARLTSTSQTITFSGLTYTLAGAKSLDNANRTFMVDLQQSPYSLDSVTANFNNTQTLSFDGYGSPTSGGTVVVVSKSHQCTVTVESVNGTATITSSHPGGGGT